MSVDTKLPLAQYRIHARAIDTIQLPAYAGSAWRGLFGHSLKALVCVTGKPTCENCLLYRNCVYSYVFETPPPADTQVMRKYKAVPHPYVLRPDLSQKLTVQPGESLSMDMTLFGAANQHLPYVLYAFEKAGERGLGGSQGRFEVTSMSQKVADWQPIYQQGESLQAHPPQIPQTPPCPTGKVQLRLDTPLRIRLKGKEIKPDQLDFYGFFSVVMRRVSMLQQFHGEHVLDVDFKGLSAQAKTVPILTRDLYWQDWTRYSSRQKTPINMGGIMGTITLEGSRLKDFWPILHLGQFTYTGKGTVFGLGSFTLVEASA